MEYLVLVIDDDHEDRMLISEAFKDLSPDTRIMAFEGGEQALAQIFNCKMTSAADFILLDINMPKHDGFMVLRQLKSVISTCKIPVYMFSTSNDPADEHQAKALGAVDYFCKPASMDGYRQVAARILNSRVPIE